ncbi:MAG: GntR family transcriptional regulator [Anaerolineaceae bacterium]|nr:GntR family transcriptional regulator [Anaerolineaceae bacterium]
MNNEVHHSRPRDEIVERIECLIIEQQLKPGDRLPAERELCEIWECNRMTFRAAVKRLIAEGKLINIPDTGNYVAPQKLERYLQDLTSFSDFVMLKGRQIDNRLISSCLVSATTRMAEKLKIPAGSDVFELVRLRIVDKAPILLETAQIPCTKFDGIQKYDFERLSLYSVLERKYGVIFGGGTEEITITYADTNEADLLSVREGEALFYLKGITWDENEDPIELIKSVSRTDRLSFAGILH